jgi:hypothetical protein
VGLAVGVVISDSMESLVALHYFPSDFLFLGSWVTAKRRKFKLTHTAEGFVLRKLTKNQVKLIFRVIIAVVFFTVLWLALR